MTNFYNFLQIFFFVLFKTSMKSIFYQTFLSFPPQFSKKNLHFDTTRKFSSFLQFFVDFIQFFLLNLNSLDPPFPQHLSLFVFKRSTSFVIDQRSTRAVNFPSLSSRSRQQKFQISSRISSTLKLCPVIDAASSKIKPILLPNDASKQIYTHEHLKCENKVDDVTANANEKS